MLNVSPLTLTGFPVGLSTADDHILARLAAVNPKATPTVAEMAALIKALPVHRFAPLLWATPTATHFAPRGTRTVIGNIRNIKTPDETPRRDDDMDNPHIPGESGGTGPNRRNDDDDISSDGSDSGMGGGDRGDPSP